MEQSAGNGVLQPKLRGVECRSRDEGPILSTVEKITGERATNVGHMDTDLMGASGVQFQAEKGAAAVTGEGLIMGAGRQTALTHLAGNEGIFHRTNGGIHHAAGGIGCAVTHRQIDAAEMLGVEGGFQTLLSIDVFGDHQKSRSALIQTVDRMIIGIQADFLVIMKDEITQRIVKVTVAGMGENTGLLVDHQNIFVLIDDVQRAIGGDNTAFHNAVSHAYREYLTASDGAPYRDPFSVQQDAVIQPFDASKKGA